MRNYLAHKKNHKCDGLFFWKTLNKHLKNYGPCLPISFGHLKFAQTLLNPITHLSPKVVGRNHILKDQFKPKIVKQDNNVIKQG